MTPRMDGFRICLSLDPEPVFPEKGRQGYRTFQKLSGNITLLSVKSSPELSDFLKKVCQSHQTFQKKFVEVRGLFEKYEGSKRTTPRLILQGILPDFLKIVCQSHSTFQKLSGKVTGLFENSSPRSSNFLKIAWQSYWTF